MKARAEVLNRILEGRDADFRIEYHKVWRNNCEKEAYVLRGKVANAAPVMYKGEWYEKANEDVVDFLCLAFSEYALMVDTQGFSDAENVKRKILPRVSSADNEEMMARADICYLEPVEGLLTSFYLPVALSKEQEGSLQITNTLLQTLSISPDEAYEAAVKNMSETIRITTVEELLAGMFDVTLEDDPADPPALTVVTTQEKQFGAAAVLAEGLYENLTKRLGSERLVMLPSSIHEVLVTAVDEDADLTAFTNMVREVNESVQPEDRLAENAYLWNKNGVLQAIA